MVDTLHTDQFDEFWTQSMKEIRLKDHITPLIYLMPESDSQKAYYNDKTSLSSLLSVFGLTIVEATQVAIPATFRKDETNKCHIFHDNLNYLQKSTKSSVFLKHR